MTANTVAVFIITIGNSTAVKCYNGTATTNTHNVTIAISKTALNSTAGKGHVTSRNSHTGTFTGSCTAIQNTVIKLCLCIVQHSHNASTRSLCAVDDDIGSNQLTAIFRNTNGTAVICASSTLNITGYQIALGIISSSAVLQDQLCGILQIEYSTGFSIRYSINNVVTLQINGDLLAINGDLLSQVNICQQLDHIISTGCFNSLCQSCILSVADLSVCCVVTTGTFAVDHVVTQSIFTGLGVAIATCTSIGGVTSCSTSGISYSCSILVRLNRNLLGVTIVTDGASVSHHTGSSTGGSLRLFAGIFVSLGLNHLTVGTGTAVVSSICLFPIAISMLTFVNILTVNTYMLAFVPSAVFALYSEGVAAILSTGSSMITGFIGNISINMLANCDCATNTGLGSLIKNVLLVDNRVATRTGLGMSTIIHVFVSIVVLQSRCAVHNLVVITTRTSNGSVTSFSTVRISYSFLIIVIQSRSSEVLLIQLLVTYRAVNDHIVGAVFCTSRKNLVPLNCCSRLMAQSIGYNFYSLLTTGANISNQTGTFTTSFGILCAVFQQVITNQPQMLIAIQCNLVVLFANIMENIYKRSCIS